MLDICCITSNLNYLISKSDESWLWHKRIAHIHMQHLNEHVLKNLVDILPKLKFDKYRISEAC